MECIEAARSLHALLQKVIVSGTPKHGGAKWGTDYATYSMALKEEPDFWKLVPEWVRENQDLEKVAELLRAKFPAIKARQEHVTQEFMGLYDFIGHLESAASHPAFIVSTQTYIARLFEVLKARGANRAIGALYTAKRFEWEGRCNDFGFTRWHLKFHLPYDKVYSRYSYDEWASVAREIESALQTIGASDDDDCIDQVRIVPMVAANPDWRTDAHGVLTGNRKVVHNQANVRSDNPPHLKEDGLYFRSQPEILVYRAFKAEGVVFAPLPVFLQGGRSYRRVEPDFVIFRNHKVTVVEVDGDVFHKENPAEAQERLRLFYLEGADTEHVKAEDCDTDEKAKAAVKALLARIDTRHSRR